MGTAKLKKEHLSNDSSRMSKATKRKHVTKEAVDDYFVPEGDEEIVKIFAPRGNNLHEVENASGHRYLVSMPTKFRKNIWVKRGDFVVTVPIKEGNKVQGEIVYILLAKQIKYLKDEKLWPEEFSQQEAGPGLPESEKEEKSSDEIKANGNVGEDRCKDNEDSDSESESSDDELFENPNHRPVYYMEETSEEETSEDEDEASEDDSDVDGAGGGEKVVGSSPTSNEGSELGEG